MKPFDFVNSINFTKKNLMRGSDNDELSEKSYAPYLTNKSLSYFTDTLLYANEMNRMHFLDNKLQYEFFLNSIRKKKRFAKWAKADKNDDLVMISEYYQISLSKAKEAIRILTPEQLSTIRNKMEQGIKND
jgi:hypothetical protein|tara:strand:- start:268 stop:660 length:393 start_codon:yes stop_codon:yes gene_type:complete